MPEGANTPNRYVMHSMTISNNEGYQLDIKQIYQDFMISESIYSNHIGGYVTVIDGSNVFNRIGFTGQEYIRIHFSGIEGIDTEVPFEEQVDITCRIHKVSAMKRPLMVTLDNINYILFHHNLLQVKEKDYLKHILVPYQISVQKY